MALHLWVLDALLFYELAIIAKHQYAFLHPTHTLLVTSYPTALSWPIIICYHNSLFRQSSIDFHHQTSIPWLSCLIICRYQELRFWRLTGDQYLCAISELPAGRRWGVPPFMPLKSCFWLWWPLCSEVELIPLRATSLDEIHGSFLFKSESTFVLPFLNSLANAVDQYTQCKTAAIYVSLEGRIWRVPAECPNFPTWVWPVLSVICHFGGSEIVDVVGRFQQHKLCISPKRWSRFGILISYQISQSKVRRAHIRYILAFKNKVENFLFPFLQMISQ